MLLANLVIPAQRTTRYLYGGESQWQVCEERGAFSQTTATYVYGNYIDDVLQMQQRCTDCPTCGNGIPLPADCIPGGLPVDYYYHADDLFNVMAVTDAAGDVVERYEYDDYGTPQFLNPDGSPIADGRSLIANSYLFTGRRYDPETTWYNYRTRYLDPAAGRFTTRDVTGIWGDPYEFGNGYAYVGNNPASWLDAYGFAPGRVPRIPHNPPPGWPKNFKWDGERWTWRVSEGHNQFQGHFDSKTRRLFPGDLKIDIEIKAKGPKSRTGLSHRQMSKLKKAGIIGGVAGIVLGFVVQFADALDHFADKKSACGAWFRAANSGDCRAMGIHQDDCRNELIAARLPHAGLNFDNVANKAKRACENAHARKKKPEDSKKSGCNG